MTNEIAGIFDSAREQGMTLAEYLASNFNADGLNHLQDNLKEEISLRKPLIDGFRSTYDRSDSGFAPSSANAAELDRMQAELQNKLAAKKEELKAMTEPFSSTILVREMELA